jgi:hypothetical protein
VRWQFLYKNSGATVAAEHQKASIEFTLTVPPKTFVWTADPDKIIAAATRGHQVMESIQ